MNQFHDPYSDPGCIDDEELNQQTLVDLFCLMTKIRSSEQQIAKGRKDGLIGGPVHLSVGQEAIPAGISKWLTSNDAIYGGHRSHSHLLALGSSVYKLFCEVLGKNDGFCQGKGGSMHLCDANNGFMGSVPIVAGTVPLAVGSALSFKLRSLKHVAVAYLGDGAVEEGIVHESLNFASVHGLPIIFVVENNLYSSHMHISQRQPANYTARFAEANNIRHEIVDGNNATKICGLMKDVIDSMRANRAPFFLEAMTYRWFGHVDWREDIDVGINRSIDEINAWKSRDPIRRLEEFLLDRGILSKQQINSLRNGIHDEIVRCWVMAVESKPVSDSALLENIYS